MKLIDILNKKGYNTDKHTNHNYIQDYYDEAFMPYKEQNINFLEIGILAGESMKLWHDYFINAKNIVGIDIFARVSRPQVESNLRDFDVKLHTINSHGDGEFVTGTAEGENRKLKDFKKYYGGFDIIIDDGHHRASSQINTYNKFSDLMNKGGLYIIEDISQQSVSEIEKNIPKIQFLISNGDHFKNQPFGVIKY